MGLDMYLFKTEEFIDMEWATPYEEEKENEYEKQIILMRKNGIHKIPAFYVSVFTLFDGTEINVSTILEVNDLTLTIRAWEEDYSRTEKVIPKREIRFIKYTYAYWRKANQIHNWFVNTVQDGIDDCGEYEVTNEQLVELLDLCYQIKNNPSRASENLPTKSGFFFGDTDYDDNYMWDINDTIEQLKSIRIDEPEEFIYQSSW